MELSDRTITTVSHLGTHLTFVSDSQDVRAIQESLGIVDALAYDSFFVAQQDGDYTEVWGMVGIVPRLSKLVTRFI